MWHGEPNRVLRSLALGLNAAGAALAIVVALGAWSCSEPGTGHPSDTLQRMESCQELLRKEHDVRAEHDRLRQQLDDARRKDEALRKRIPDGPREADFLAQVSQAAGEVGLQITDYRHTVMAAEKLCSSMRVELSCEGDYRGICRLLDRLRELPRYSTVARCEINAGAAQTKCLAKICLELYFFGSTSQPAKRQA